MILPIFAAKKGNLAGMSIVLANSTRKIDTLFYNFVNSFGAMPFN